MRAIVVASLRDQLYESIMESILTNQYHPGEVLQIDRLADDFGVSTTPVREALLRLESTGLVSIIPNKGAKVTQVSGKDVVDLWEVRKILEPFVAKLAAERVPVSLVEAVRDKLLHVLASLGDFAAYMDSDIELHELLSSHLTNAVLEDILKRIGRQYTRIRYFAEGNTHDDRRQVIKEITQEHLDIVTALLEKDTEKVSFAVLQHLHNGERRTLEAVMRRQATEQK